MILVSGASGAIGCRLVKELAGKGWKVRALVLPGDPLALRVVGSGCEVCEGDIRDPASLNAAFLNVQTVYHLAAVVLSHDPRVFETVNVGGTRNMLESAARAGAKHFIHVSSASVVYPRSTPYSRSKRECERLVAVQRSLPFTIVRPTLVYDSNGGQEFMLFLKYLKKFPVVPFVGRGRALKSPVHVDDLIGGLLSLVGNERSYGKTYNLCGGEAISLRELAELMLKHSAAEKPFVPVPVPICKLAAILMRALMKNPPLTLSAIAGLTQDADLDPSLAAADLGYAPMGVREGLTKCFPLHHQTESERA